MNYTLQNIYAIVRFLIFIKTHLHEMQLVLPQYLM